MLLKMAMDKPESLERRLDAYLLGKNLKLHLRQEKLFWVRFLIESKAVLLLR